ncbi:Peptide deformylase 2 [Azospirillaceae bacterium]
MTLLKIARLGHPVLRRVAAPVPDPTAPEIVRLAADMIETMNDAPGIGLAAPQVHVSLRVVVFRVPGERGGKKVDPTVLINPEIEAVGDELVDAWEGCLSVPGLRGGVTRPKIIRYRGYGVDGALVEREVDGLHARVVQHETDHLDGLVYLDRMLDMQLLVFESEMRHMINDDE